MLCSNLEGVRRNYILLYSVLSNMLNLAFPQDFLFKNIMLKGCIPNDSIGALASVLPNIQ